MISPTVRNLVFRAVDGDPIGFVAGQWVNLFLPWQGETVRRAYSIASWPGYPRPDELEIAVTLVPDGPASTALHTMEVGARIEMEGPWGVFTRERGDPERPMIFVGTGTGVTPLRSMIHADLEERPQGPPLLLLFGCRTEEEILFRIYLEDLATHHPRLRYHFTLSRAPENWGGRSGYVQKHLPELYGSLAPAHVFICGLSGMVAEVRRLLKEDLGLDRKSIHAERYD
ncbi:MAG: FAD-dependent oxidoreductase [Myxococcales bacterium]|nr:FAD-dependent oxidoreductase [Myxococcales bacterium]